MTVQVVTARSVTVRAGSGPGRRRFLAGVAAGLAASGGRAHAADDAIVVHVDDGGQLVVSNVSARAVRLDRTVAVEGMSPDGWIPVTTEMFLVASCGAEGLSHPPRGPVVLPARTSLRPPRWRGWTCAGQCQAVCRGNLYLGAGPFRFGVVPVPIAPAVWSNPFTMPRTP